MNRETLTLIGFAVLLVAAGVRAQIVIRDAVKSGHFGRRDVENSSRASVSWLMGSSIKVIGYGVRGKSRELSSEEMKAAGAFVPLIAALIAFVGAGVAILLKAIGE